MTDTIRIIGGVALKQIPVALLAPYVDPATIYPSGMSAREVIACVRGVKWQDVPTVGLEEELLRLLAEYVAANPPPAPRRYGCHNKPRPAADSSYKAQDGYYSDFWGNRIEPKWVSIKSVFGPDRIGCQYDKSATDAACAGCQHARENP